MADEAARLADEIDLRGGGGPVRTVKFAQNAGHIYQKLRMYTASAGPSTPRLRRAGTAQDRYELALGLADELGLDPTPVQLGHAQLLADEAVHSGGAQLSDTAIHEAERALVKPAGRRLQTDGPVWGGIVGTEDDVVWTDLTKRRFRATECLPIDRTPRRPVSALELYDIEFGYRLDIARAAQAHTRRSAPLLVQPTKIDECASCDWWTACKATLEAGSGDVSLVPGVGQRADRLPSLPPSALGI